MDLKSLMWLKSCEISHITGFKARVPPMGPPEHKTLDSN